MKVTAVYIVLESYSYPIALRVRYQLASNYLSLFISDWLKQRELDQGRFNRLVFVEGSEVDMQVKGDRAFAVRISETALGLGSPFCPEREALSDVEVHSYFVGKYLEGFNRVDDYFGTVLSEALVEAIRLYFSNTFGYEMPVGGRGIKSEQLRLFHRYTMDRYQLIAKEVGGDSAGLPTEYELMELIPDPFKVSYHVSSIAVDGRRISIANKTGREVVVKEI